MSKTGNRHRSLNGIASAKNKTKAQSAASKNPDKIEKIIKKIDKTTRDTRISKKKKDWKNDEIEVKKKQRASYSKPADMKAIKQISADLPGYQRALGLLMHGKIIEKINGVLAYTIARPVGLLSGAAASLGATLCLFYISQYYGYEYNYLAGLAAFAAGYIIGTFIEVIYKIIKRY